MIWKTWCYIITKHEKGNAVVILDRTIYNEWILEILNDKTKFKVIKKNPTDTRETKIPSPHTITQHPHNKQIPLHKQEHQPKQSKQPTLAID